MNTIAPAPRPPVNPFAGFLIVAALLLAAWAAGFFMGGTERVGDGDPEPGDIIAPHFAVEKEVASSADPSPGDAQGGTADERRSRVLASLEAAMRQANPARQFQTLPALIAQIGPAEIHAAIELAQRQPGEHDFYVELLLTRWAEIDPRAAADFVLTGFGAGRRKWERQNALSTAASEWARADAAAAKAWALAMPAGKDQQVALTGVAKGMAEADPMAGLACIRLIPSDARVWVSRDFFKDWSAHDPLMASQQALAMPKGAEREATIAGVTEGWSQKDPKAAFDWARQFAQGDTRRQATDYIFRRWAESDPAAAMKEASQLPPEEFRTRAMSTIVQVLGGHDADAALRMMQQFPEGPERVEAVQEVASQLSDWAPETAAKLLASIPKGDNRRDLNTALQNWAHESPADAVAFVEKELPAGKARNDAISAVAPIWAQKDPRAAAEWLAKSIAKPDPPEVRGESAFSGTARSWAFRDPQAALDWINARPEGPQKTRFLQGAIEGVALLDPAQASGLLGPLPKNEKYDTAGNVAREWTKQNLAAATEWAEQATDPVLRDAALPIVVGALATSDVTKATALIETLPEGRLRDWTVREFAGAVKQDDPEAAATWASTMSDAKRREDELSYIFRDWKKADEAAAKRWLENTEALSPEKKKEMLGK